ncbi:MAG: YdcF family protein, partial [Bacteroidetes bacterium]|nr:YdcF family protein [Bacteroidota bacterium]
IETAKLYHQGTIKKIIVSGGSGSLDQSRPKEASFVRDEFIKQGIPASDVFFENQSRNTFENAQNCKKLLDSLNIQGAVVLVTSAMHVRRASLIFKTTKRDIIPYPGNYEEINMKFSWDEYIIPDIETIIHWQKFLKEIVGLLMYKITGKG